VWRVPRWASFGTGSAEARSRSGQSLEASAHVTAEHARMATTPMSPTELAGWTAQQSARHEHAFAAARAAHTRARPYCTCCGRPRGSSPAAGEEDR
jgi:hypothetical protein